MDCPECGKQVSQSNGSPVSPYIHTYRCSCGWTALRCGNSSCDHYLEVEEVGYPASVRYTCPECSWTGMGPRV